MGGEVCTFESLVHSDRHPSASRYNNVSEDEIDAVPTLIDLFKCFIKFSKGKACGEGLLVSDVFSNFFLTALPLRSTLLLSRPLSEFNPPSNGKVV